MKRKDFIRNGLFGTGMFVASSAFAGLLKKHDDELPALDPIGFNHLPNQPTIMMENMILHKATTRGHANHGWLDSYHSFSFANYYNPERMHFGVLRVLNDDTVAPGMGFGTHPHDNMEIISIPLSGDLEHKDSMGTVAVIKQGDIQVMSAGTGISHSEYNKNKDKEVKFLQIWVIPNKKNVKPRYDQISINKEDRKNKFQQILSPNAEDAGVWIHQDAWFYLADLEKGKQLQYKLKNAKNGVYVFVLNGEVEANGQKLEKRDGLGIWNNEQLELKGTDNAEVLVMEVPMMLS
jgi:redox-sensitive bicupin YhaK (pirin superfamily)